MSSLPSRPGAAATAGTVPRRAYLPEPGACLPDLTYYWNRIQACAGLEGIRIHDLTHTIASSVLVRGETPR